MAKRKSPTPEELERIAEAIDSLDTFNNIQDRDSFDSAVDDYFEGDESMIKNTKVRNEVFDDLREMHPRRITDESLFKKAKGKSLKQDRRRTAKRTVTSKQEYIKRGARRTDLKGYDTKTKQKKKRSLDIAGKVRGKVVFSSKEFVVVKGKKLVRHRDKLGRFVSIKRK